MSYFSAVLLGLARKFPFNELFLCCIVGNCKKFPLCLVILVLYCWDLQENPHLVSYFSAVLLGIARKFPFIELF
jgi:hypothetical protein